MYDHNYLGPLENQSLTIALLFDVTKTSYTNQGFIRAIENATDLPSSGARPELFDLFIDCPTKRIGSKMAEGCEKDDYIFAEVVEAVGVFFTSVSRAANNARTR